MLDAGLDAVCSVIAEGVIINEAAEGAEHWCAQGAERSRSQVQTLQVGVEQVSADGRRPRGALTHIVIAINKEAVASRVVNDVVIRDEQPGKGLRSVAKDGLATPSDAATIHDVLVDGDVRAAAVHEDSRRGIIAKPIVSDLHVIVGPDTGEDATARASRTSREGEAIDRDQAADGNKELRRGGHSRSDD
jgi:hypothetical protein